MAVRRTGRLVRPWGGTFRHQPPPVASCHGKRRRLRSVRVVTLAPRVEKGRAAAPFHPAAAQDPAARLPASSPPGRRGPAGLSGVTPPSALNRPVPPSPPAMLQPEQALQLLAQSGREPPPGEPGSPGWVQGLIDALVELSSRDALTGVANRRAFELALGREIDRVARSGEPALLLVLDIDHFKRVNDTWGHGAGDEVIKAVAQALVECVRPMDLAARIGGEEFAIILPNCGSAFGQTVAERVRRRVETTPITIGPRQTISVSVSIGGAFGPQWVRSTPQLWLDRADQQLYRAKVQGRNLVQLEPAAVSVVSAEEKRLLFDSFQIQDHE
jgi:diguanylate cyclase